VHLSLEGGIPIVRSLEVENGHPVGIVAVNVEATAEVGRSEAVVEVETIEMIAAKVEVAKVADEILNAEANAVTAGPPPGKRSNKKQSNR
jgi:hypothetical protein